MNQAVGITLTDLEQSALVRVCDADTASSASHRLAWTFAAVEPASLSIRLRQATPFRRCRRPRPVFNALDTRDVPTRPRRMSPRNGTYVAGRRRGEFFDQPQVRTDAQ